MAQASSQHAARSAPTGHAAETDVLIIGGGHNGLTCAAYLAKAGLSVRLLERRGILGGAAVTEEFYPGFKNSTASYTVSLLNPKVISDLNLHAHGLDVRERPMANFWPLGTDAGDYLDLPYGAEAARAAIARLSEKDASRLDDYYNDLGRVADVLKALILETPPNLGGGIAAMVQALKAGRLISKLPLRDKQAVLDLFSVSAAEFLGRYFEHPAVLAAFGFDGIVGHFGSPYAPGTAYVLLHHAFGEVNGKAGVWGHAVGGMGAISGAIAASARSYGAELLVNAEVSQLLTEQQRGKKAVVGARTTAGSTYRAKRVVIGLGPKRMMETMVPSGTFPQAFEERMQAYVCHSGVLRMNVALSRLPNFSALPAGGPQMTAPDGSRVPAQLGSGIIIGPSLDYMDTAWRDARTHGWAQAPVVEMLIPSLLDASLAPAGQHVASLFCQQFSYSLPDGRSWAEARADAAEHVLATVEKYAPGFRASVLGYAALTPKDLEDTLSLSGGDIFHGRLSLDQMFSARPALGSADYRLPLNGLYLCGSGAHPGGGVTGVPGMMAARQILKDVRSSRWNPFA